jgi:hypothetical protein
MDVAMSLLMLVKYLLVDMASNPKKLEFARWFSFELLSYFISDTLFVLMSWCLLAYIGSTEEQMKSEI